MPLNPDHRCRTCNHWNTTSPEVVREAPCVVDGPKLMPAGFAGVWPYTNHDAGCFKWRAIPKPKGEPPPRTFTDLQR